MLKFNERVAIVLDYQTKSLKVMVNKSRPGWTARYEEVAELKTEAECCSFTYNKKIWNKQVSFSLKELLNNDHTEDGPSTYTMWFWQDIECQES